MMTAYHFLTKPTDSSNSIVSYFTLCPRLCVCVCVCVRAWVCVFLRSMSASIKNVTHTDTLVSVMFPLCQHPSVTMSLVTTCRKGQILLPFPHSKRHSSLSSILSIEFLALFLLCSGLIKKRKKITASNVESI